MQLSHRIVSENSITYQARLPQHRETLHLKCAPASLVRIADRILTTKEMDMCCRATD